MLVLNNNIVEEIYLKVDKLKDAAYYQEKDQIINEILDLFDKLSREKIVDLMADSNELIRNMAARIYVEKHFDDSLDFLCELLNNDNENVRDSAVISMCYMNSPENLEMLEKAVNDNSDFVKFRALAGIADIAFDFENKKAKTILEDFRYSDDIKVRKFIDDELSLLTV